MLFVLGATVRADAGPIDCENHDQLPNVRREQILGCRHQDHGRIRAAARRFCTTARGTQRDRCARIEPLLVRCRCPIELHRTGDDGDGEPATPYAWLGGDPQGHELYWGVELVRTRRGWRVTEVFVDDYERP